MSYRVARIMAVCLVATVSGCCAYHQESVDNLKTIKGQIPALYSGFTSAPAAGEQTQADQIKTLFSKTVDQEKSIWFWCRQTSDAVTQAEQTFESQVGDRQKKLPKPLPQPLVDAYKNQIDTQLNDAILAIQARKTGS